MPHFGLSPVSDESVFDTARHTYCYTMDLPVSADRVWAGLVAPQPLQWCRALNGRYTSNRPFGVGATRVVTVRKVLTLHEKFFVWDDDARHHAFYVERTNIPFFGMFAEDYRVTPRADGCRFEWRFAIEARPGFATVVARTQGATKRLLLDQLASDTRAHFGTEPAPLPRRHIAP